MKKLIAIALLILAVFLTIGMDKCEAPEENQVTGDVTAPLQEEKTTTPEPTKETTTEPKEVETEEEAKALLDCWLDRFVCEEKSEPKVMLWTDMPDINRPDADDRFVLGSTIQCGAYFYEPTIEDLKYLYSKYNFELHEVDACLIIEAFEEQKRSNPRGSDEVWEMLKEQFGDLLDKFKDESSAKGNNDDGKELPACDGDECEVA